MAQPHPATRKHTGWPATESAATPDSRINEMNRDMTILRGKEATSIQLADRAALRSVLTEHFGFDLPEIEQLTVPAIPEWQ
jgi:N-hydroxyarylamine O-acetyltransferase